MSGQPSAISWDNNFDATMERARAEGRDVLVDFSAAPM
jgi:hypothetical protein